MRTRDIQAVMNKIIWAKKQFEKMNEKYPKKYAEELYLVGDNVITEWYSTYDPIFYNRSGSLYNAFKIDIGKDNGNIEFDSSLMGGNDIIFENSFMNGYHGGAIKGPGHPNPGIPYWRTPIQPIERRFKEWGRPALRSFSPYYRMISKMNKKIKEINKEKQKEYDEISDKVEKLIKKL